MRRPFPLLVTSLVSAALAACVEPDPAGLGDDPSADLEDGKADGGPTLPLRFLPGELTVPTAAIGHEVRAVYHDAAELTAGLGIANPGIDFATEWAVFYAPGAGHPDLAPGFRARIDTVALSATGRTLKVTTALEHNGDCAPRSARPFVLVAIPIVAVAGDELPDLQRFYRADRTRSCGAVSWYDGVSFTSAQAAAALRAANMATAAELGAAGITGSPRTRVLAGRPWSTLGQVAGTAGIGPATMTKLRALGADF
ncbi:MAG: hypothetical protein R2939_00410 [Kofleriaceae bacterium]